MLRRSLYLFLSVLIVLLSCLKEGYAQTTYQDVLYLKSGKILRGTIQSIENQRISFVSDTGTMLMVNMEEVSKIRKEKNNNRLKSVKDTVFKSKGFQTIVEYSYYKGMGELTTRIGVLQNTLQSHSISISHGYLVAPTVFLGLGAGYDRYEFFKFVPLFLEVRTDLIKERIRPTFRLKIGHSLGWRDGGTASDWAGFMIQSDLGVKLMLSHARAVYFGIGLKSQQVKVTYSIFRNNAPPLFTFERLGHGFVAINVGFHF